MVVLVVFFGNSADFSSSNSAKNTSSNNQPNSFCSNRDTINQHTPTPIESIIGFTNNNFTIPHIMYPKHCHPDSSSNSGTATPYKSGSDFEKLSAAAIRIISLFIQKLHQISFRNDHLFGAV